MENMENKDSWDKQGTIVKVVALLILVLLFATIHFFAPHFFKQIGYLATSGNMDATVHYLRSFGPWAMVVSFLLDVLINAVGFLPSIFLSTANGLVFGLPIGILISWSAESVGVIISFLIMRYFLRESAEAIIEKSNSLKKLDEMSGKNGLTVMAIARTMPYFPSGILTALGAVSKMSIKDYVIASFIGKFPSTALEVVVGHDAVNFRENMHRLTVLITVIAIIYAYMYWRKRKNEKESEK